VNPRQNLAVEVVQVRESCTDPEVVLNVLDAAFHTSFRLSSIRPAQPNVKAQTERKVQELAVPDGLARRVSALHHQLGIVVQTRLGKAAKLGERVEMAANERLGRGPGDNLYVQGPGPAEHHHKGPYPPLLAVSRAVRKRAPVHLGLLTRGGFEPHSGLAGRHPPAERPDEVLEDGVSTGVPLLPDFAQKDDAVVYSLTQTVHDILLVGVQLGRAPGTGLPGQGAVRIPQVAANCVPGDSQCLGDFPDRLFPLQLKDGFHFPTLQQSITPPTLAGIGSVFAGGWVNSFPPFMGQFITADHKHAHAGWLSALFNGSLGYLPLKRAIDIV